LLVVDAGEFGVPHAVVGRCDGGELKNFAVTALPVAEPALGGHLLAKSHPA
jgi:hypothetical protein